MTTNRRAKLALGLVLFGAAVIIPGTAMAQDGPAFDPSVAVPTVTEGFNLNLLFIFIGAVLVIFMQAGFAMVETGFCRSKHAAHVVTTNLAIFGLGFVGFFLIGFPMMYGGFSYPGYFGLDAALGVATDRERELGLPLEGSDRTHQHPGAGVRAGRDLLPLHGRLHGHHGDHPDGVDG